MNTIKILVILGSIRENRFGDKPAAWIFDKVKRLEGVEAEFIDLKTLALPRFNYGGYPSAVKDGNYGNEQVNTYAKKIKEADAFIIITPEYNHGYPGALKDALDWVYAEWNKKPVGFVGYGSVLGGRVIEQLRAVSIELQMTPIRAAVHIPSDVFMAVSKESAPGNFELFKPIEEKAQTMLDQLLWWARALKSARQQ